jgi:hypothetical protein
MKTGCGNAEDSNLKLVHTIGWIEIEKRKNLFGL